MSTTINKQLGLMEDLSAGVGEVEQSRNGVNITGHKVDVPYAVSSVLEMQALPITKYSNCRVYVTPTSYEDYRYSQTSTNGYPSVSSGTWVRTGLTEVADILSLIGAKVAFPDYVGSTIHVTVNNTISNGGRASYRIRNTDPGNLSTLVDGIWVGANHYLGNHGGANHYAELITNDVYNVLQFGARGGTYDDTLAFQSAAELAGAAGAYVPFRDEGYTVLTDISGLWGYGQITINGIEYLASYTDVSQTLAQPTAAQIAKRLSDGEQITFALFGDSTMFGYQVGAPSPQDQDPNAPPITFKGTLDKLFGGNNLVIDMSYSGSNMEFLMRGADTTNEKFDKFELRIAPGGLAADAHVVYCNHGINNCQSDLSLDTFKQDYTEFVRIVRKYGKVPVLVTPLPLTPLSGTDAARKTEQLPLYAQVVRDVAEATGCDLVDAYEYTKKTAKVVTESTLMPDGIHCSTEWYRQCGRNLLIPFVSATPISKEGDIASPSGSTLLDNASSTVNAQPTTRTGVSYSSTKVASLTGITQAVILDEPAKYLSFMCSQSQTGAKVLIGEWQTAAQFSTPETRKDYGNSATTRYDYPLVVEANAWAGLHPMYFLYDTAAVDPVYNTMDYSGISIPRQSTNTYITPTFNLSPFEVDKHLLTGQKLSCLFNFIAGGSHFYLQDIDGGNVADLYITAGGNFTLDLLKDGSVVSSTVLGALANGNYALVFESGSTSVTVRVPGLNSTVAITSQLPPVLPTSHLGLTYMISPINGEWY